YGDGGAIFTDDSNLAKKMAQIRVHGQERRYVHTAVGINGRLDTLQAAILLAKFDVFPDEVADRAAAGARYDGLIRQHAVGSGSAALRTVKVADGCTSVYAQYTVRVPERERV